MDSIRIVSVEYYMSYPTQDLDVKYSEFRGAEVKQVPVLQIYGSSQNGHKTCVNIHGVFPYIYIPYDGKEPAGSLSYKIAAELDKALNTSLRQSSSNAIHIHNVVLVSGIPIYGYHERKHQFFKVYFYNPGIVNTACALLENGAILGKHFQPHERHINYILQFMIDYNLHGMSFMNISRAMYRVNPKEPNLLDDIPPDLILSRNIQCRSVCKFEIDVHASCITNRDEISDGELTANPGIQALWEDEKQRRRDKDMDSQISFCLTQERGNEIHPTASHTFYENRLAEKIYSEFKSEESCLDLEKSVYPAETPEDADHLNASTVDHSVFDATLLDETIENSQINNFSEDDWKLLKILQEMKQNAQVEDDSILSQQVQEQEVETCDEEDQNLSLPLCKDVPEDDSVWENSYWEDCQEIPSQVPQVDGQFDTDTTESYHSDGYLKIDELEPVVHQELKLNIDNDYYRIASEVYIDRNNKSPDIPDEKKLNPGMNKLIITERQSPVPDASKITILSEVCLKPAENSEELCIANNNFGDKEVIINDVNLATCSPDLQKSLDAITFEAIVKSNPNSRAQSPCNFDFLDEFMQNSIANPEEEFIIEPVKRKRGRPKKTDAKPKRGRPRMTDEQKNKKPSKKKVISSKAKKRNDPNMTTPPDKKIQYNLRLSDSPNAAKHCSGCNYRCSPRSTRKRNCISECIKIEFPEEAYILSLSLENSTKKSKTAAPKRSKKTANKRNSSPERDKIIETLNLDHAEEEVVQNETPIEKLKKSKTSVPKLSRAKSKKHTLTNNELEFTSDKNRERSKTAAAKRTRANKRNLSPERDKIIERLTNNPDLVEEDLNVVQNEPPVEILQNQNDLPPIITTSEPQITNIITQDNSTKSNLVVTENPTEENYFINSNQQSSNYLVLEDISNDQSEVTENTSPEKIVENKILENNLIIENTSDKNVGQCYKIEDLKTDLNLSEDSLVESNEENQNLNNDVQLVSPVQEFITEEISTDTLNGTLQFQDSVIIRSDEESSEKEVTLNLPIEDKSNEDNLITETIPRDEEPKSNSSAKLLESPTIQKSPDENCENNLNGVTKINEDQQQKLPDLSFSKPTEEINCGIDQNKEDNKTAKSVEEDVFDVPMTEVVEEIKHGINQRMEVIEDHYTVESIEDVPDVSMSEIVEETKHDIINPIKEIVENNEAVKYIKEDLLIIPTPEEVEQIKHDDLSQNKELIKGNEDVKSVGTDVPDVEETKHDGFNKATNLNKDDETVQLVEKDEQPKILDSQISETTKEGSEKLIADNETVTAIKEDEQPNIEVYQNKELIQDNEVAQSVAENEQQNLMVVPPTEIPKEIEDSVNEEIEDNEAATSVSEHKQRNIMVIPKSKIAEEIKDSVNEEIEEGAKSILERYLLKVSTAGPTKAVIDSENKEITDYETVKSARELELQNLLDATKLFKDIEDYNCNQNTELPESEIVKSTEKDVTVNVTTTGTFEYIENCNFNQNNNKSQQSKIKSVEKDRELTLPNFTTAGTFDYVEDHNLYQSNDVQKTNVLPSESAAGINNGEQHNKQTAKAVNVNNNVTIVENKNIKRSIPHNLKPRQDKRKYKIQINCTSYSEFQLLKRKLLQWKIEDLQDLSTKSTAQQKLISLKNLDGQADSPSSDSGSQEEISKKVEETKNSKKRTRKNKMACRSPGLSKVSFKKTINKKSSTDSNESQLKSTAENQSSPNDNSRPVRNRKKSWKLRTIESSESTKNQENETIQSSKYSNEISKELRIVLTPLDCLNNKKVHFFSDSDETKSDNYEKEKIHTKEKLVKHKLTHKNKTIGFSSTDSSEEQPDKKVKTELPSAKDAVIVSLSSSDEKQKNKPKSKKRYTNKKAMSKTNTTNLNNSASMVICSSSSDEKKKIAKPVRDKRKKFSKLATKKPINCTETVKNSNSELLSYTEYAKEHTPHLTLSTGDQLNQTENKQSETGVIQEIKEIQTELLTLLANNDDQILPRITRSKTVSTAISSSNQQEKPTQNASKIPNGNCIPLEQEKNLVIRVKKLTPDQISSGSSIEPDETQVKLPKKVTNKTNSKYSPLNIVRSPRKRRNLGPHELEPSPKKLRSSNIEGIEPLAKTNKKQEESSTFQGTGELQNIPLLLKGSSSVENTTNVAKDCDVDIKTPFSIKKRLFNLETNDLNVTTYEEFKTCSYESSPAYHFADYDINIDINYLRNLRKKEEQFLRELTSDCETKTHNECSPVKTQQDVKNNISCANYNDSIENNLNSIKHNILEVIKTNINQHSTLNSQTTTRTPTPIRKNIKKKDKNPISPSKYKKDPDYIFFTPEKKSPNAINDVYSPQETLSQRNEKELINIGQFNTKISNLTVAEEYDLQRDFAPLPGTSKMPSKNMSPDISFTYNDISLMDNTFNQTQLCTQNLSTLNESSISYNINSSRIWMPKYFPPSKDDIENTLAVYNIPEHRFREPFYSDYSDVTGKVDIGHNVLKISSTSAVDLDEFEACIDFCGIEKWRKDKFKDLYPTETVCKNLKVALAGHKRIVMMPVYLAPTRKEIIEWIETKNNEFEKNVVTKMEKLRILVPQSPGNSNDSFNDSLTLSPYTPENSNPSGNIIEPSQTPVSSQTSPVNSRRRQLRKRNNLQRKVLFSQCHQEEKLKLIDRAENQSSNDSCQISGVTLNNTHGFQMSFENLQEAKAVSEYQYLTVLVVELHIRTRGDFYPDPQYDSVRAIFYSILNDVPEDFYLPRKETGIIVVDTLPGSPVKQTRPILDGTGVKSKITYVKSEQELIEQFINLVRKWDPDIFTGFEIEMLSWGYLIDRCYVIGINLPIHISRINPDILQNKHQEQREKEELKLAGRIILDAWRLFRHEIALQSYTFENLMFHILHQRVPTHSFKNLSFCWEYRSNYFRHITANYYITRVEGVLKLLDQLDLIGRTSELARLFGIQFYEVLSRGSQFRVESMMLRLAKPLNYIPISPSIQQRAKMRAPEWVPLILEPESRFYVDPVIVLDFQSLYPSIIIAYNYCYSTCIGRVENLGTDSPFEFGACQLKVTRNGIQNLGDKINFSPCGVGFVKPEIRKGILPRMLTEILETRLMVKSSMKENKDNKLLQRVLHSRQLGLKLIANVTYGYTSANFSGRMPCIEIGDSVVSKGRETLERAIKLIEQTDKWRAKVVYGDTDSLFVLVAGRSRQEAFAIGAEIAEAVTNDNPPPVKLKLEKVYQPCILQTKKRYVGYMYESPGQTEPEYNAKGIETVRRDGCPAVAKMLEKTLRLLFETRDMSLVKRYTVRQFEKILTGRASFQDLIFAREFRGLSGYRPGACVPALELAKRWTAVDKRREPRRSERVPYLIVHGPPGVPLIRLVKSPMELINQDQSLRPNAVYYITRVIAPPLNRCLGLIGVDVQAWFNEMPRKQLQILPTEVHFEKTKKSTISQYFATMSCVVCTNQTKDGLCKDCCLNHQQSVVVLQEKLRQWERSYDDVLQICQSCCGRAEYTECISLDCPVLYRLTQIKRDLKQVPFVRNLLSKFS